jgi:hypothetical protein
MSIDELTALRAEIARLTAENGKLRDVLKPFGESCPADDRIPGDELLAIRNPRTGQEFNYVSVAEFRAAWSAVKDQGAEARAALTAQEVPHAD